MPSIEESLGTQSPLNAALKAGLESLDQQQIVTFTKYVKLVLPLDGYVFWVKADLLSASAVFNVARLNAAPYNAAPRVVAPAAMIEAKGSLHVASDSRQEETETYAVNRVIFTSEQPVQAFTEIGPTVLYIAEHEGIRFAFSARRSFYRQADLYHYVGNAVYSDMATQIVDKLDGFDTSNVIVSNSLPLWLALNGYGPPYAQFGNSILLYPSFLLPARCTSSRRRPRRCKPRRPSPAISDTGSSSPNGCASRSTGRGISARSISSIASTSTASTPTLSAS
jgi:hypothetical protein